MAPTYGAKLFSPKQVERALKKLISKQLTKAESELVESVRNELIEAEKKVKKEVSDVDDIV